MKLLRNFVNDAERFKITKKETCQNLSKKGQQIKKELIKRSEN